MSWDALVVHEQRAFDPAWAFEAWKTRNPRANAYNGPVLRSVWADAVRWVLTAQQEWPRLVPAQAVQELRKGSASIFYPIFETDPTFWADCPRDGRTAINQLGTCLHCSYDFT